MLEAIILAVGAKTCCIASAGIGGAANVLTKKKFSWKGVKDIAIAIAVGWIAAEFFIPPIMKHWGLDMLWGPAIAFLIGYSGIRFLPKIEQIITSRLSKG
jgi:hypothetical protein